jgi:hypothetical protein
MKTFFGYEMDETIVDSNIIDRDEDLLIYEKELSGTIEPIPLLQIVPQKTSLLFDDYGFFSENRNCYLYLDMICGFYLFDGADLQEKAMFLLQVDEELIAVHEDSQPIFFASNQHKPLIKKWASSYKVEIDFIF